MTNFVGNITKDAVTRKVDVAGVPNLVTDFSVAENYRKGDGTQGTQYYRISIWGPRGAKLMEYLKKGRAVAVTGRVKTRAYMDKNGNPAAQLEMSNPTIQLIGKNSTAEGEEEPVDLDPITEEPDNDKPF
jgi:single-strand DNA-binding protein